MKGKGKDAFGMQVSIFSHHGNKKKQNQLMNFHIQFFSGSRTTLGNNCWKDWLRYQPNPAFCFPDALAC